MKRWNVTQVDPLSDRNYKFLRPLLDDIDDVGDWSSKQLPCSGGNPAYKNKRARKVDSSMAASKNVAIAVKMGTAGHGVKVTSTGRVNIVQWKGSWRKSPSLIRFDKAHAGHPVPHINMNPKINPKLAFDPHIPIAGGEATLTGIQKAATAIKAANKVLIPTAIVMDGTRVAKAIWRDVKHETSRNVTEKAVDIAAGYGVGFAGAQAGAALGTLAFPGVGTLVGGVIGGIVGGVGGSLAASQTFRAVGDNLDYGIVEAVNACKICRQRYKFRKYERDDDGYCNVGCRSLGLEFDFKIRYIAEANGRPHELYMLLPDKIDREKFHIV